MDFNKSRYAKRSTVPKVVISIELDQPRYYALQRLANLRQSSQAHLLREGLNYYPEFNTLHQDEKEAYAKNENRQRSRTPKAFDPTFTKISNDPQINNDKRR